MPKSATSQMQRAQHARRLREEGMSIADIARTIGHTERYTSGLLSIAGYTGKKTDTPRAEVGRDNAKRVRALLRSGHTLDQIAETLKRSRNYMRELLKIWQRDRQEGDEL